MTLKQRLRRLRGRRGRLERVQIKRYLGAHWRWSLEAELGREPLWSAVRDFDWDAEQEEDGHARRHA